MTATTKTDCQATGMCHYDSLSRPRFFDGMLLTDDSLLAEQTYHREALKRVNRYLWGSGIVCGLEVEKVNGLCIRIRPGAALDCRGNLIEVCRCITLDLTDTCKQKWPGACIPEKAEDLPPKYLVIRYADAGVDLQPVLAADDECASSGQGTKCQPARTREGFCFELLDKCPNPEPCAVEDGMYGTYLEAQEQYLQQQGQVGRQYILAGAQVPAAAPGQMPAMQKLEQPPSMDDAPPCPQCCGCADGVVGLARLTIKCGDSSVVVEPDCRCYVWTPGLLRKLVCTFFANYEESAGRQFAAAGRQLPNVNLLLCDPIAALRQALGHLATKPDQMRTLYERMDQMEQAFRGGVPLTPAKRSTRPKPPATPPPPPAPPK